MHATICDLITDLVQNSIEANAKKIDLTIEETEQNLNVIITDNGIGMSAETLRKARDPFYTDGLKHRHRRVGLGLPFLFQTAEATGGTAAIESTEGVGTRVSFSLDRTNVDLPAFGNFATAAVTLMSYGYSGDLNIERSVEGRRYAISKRDLRKALGDLDSLESLTLMKQYIAENEAEILNG